ncbi:MAG: hypothetical protein M3177_02420, partial [Pseudomonadota bacterium]|nr:hypothetical protein [Pseudomonadota bacterium]
LDARAAGAAVSCIATSQIVARRAAPPNAVIFEMAGARTYRSAVEACPRLERASASDTISFDVHGGQLCSGDRFRVFDPSEPRAGGLASIPECRLGEFTRVVRESTH